MTLQADTGKGYLLYGGEPAVGLGANYQLYGEELAIDRIMPEPVGIGQDAENYIQHPAYSPEQAAAGVVGAMATAPAGKPINVGWGVKVYAEQYAGWSGAQIQADIARRIQLAQHGAKMRTQDKAAIKGSKDILRYAAPGSEQAVYAQNQLIVARANLALDRNQTLTAEEQAQKRQAKAAIKETLKGLTTAEAINLSTARRPGARLLPTRSESAAIQAAAHARNVQRQRQLNTIQSRRYGGIGADDNAYRQEAARLSASPGQYRYQEDLPVFLLSGDTSIVELAAGELGLDDGRGGVLYDVGSETDMYLQAMGFDGLLGVVDLPAPSDYNPLEAGSYSLGDLSGGFFSKIGKAFRKVGKTIKKVVKKIAKPVVAGLLIAGGIAVGSIGVGLPIAGAMVGAGVGVATKKGSGIGSFRTTLPRAVVGGVAGYAAGWLAPAAWTGGGGLSTIGGGLVKAGSAIGSGFSKIGGAIFGSRAPATPEMISDQVGGSGTPAGDAAATAAGGGSNFDWSGLTKMGTAVAGALLRSRESGGGGGAASEPQAEGPTYYQQEGGAAGGEGGAGGGGGGAGSGSSGAGSEGPPYPGEPTGPEPGGAGGLGVSGVGIAIAIGAVALLLASRK